MVAASVERIAEALQDAEIVVLKTLLKAPLILDELAKKALLDQSAVSRACLWLQNKALVEVRETPQTLAVIEKLGREYVEWGLPERRFAEALGPENLFLDEIAEKAKLNKQEIQFALGELKKKNVVSFAHGKIQLENPKAFEKETFTEAFLRKLEKEGEIDITKLAPEEKKAFEELCKRGIVKKSEKTIREYWITELGKKVASAVKGGQRIGMLTPEIIKSGSWKNAFFRRYDVEAQVPKLLIGKKQAYRAFVDEVKEELVAMGFEEMLGPIVETSFWNNDALFMPQDHPARGIHDIYYIREPKYGRVSNVAALKAVKAVHENGGKSGGTGWQYNYDEKEAARLILRTQGTALSARMLADKNIKIPGAYFAIARCYRPDILDASHLVEFNQCEGIVLGEKLNLRNLLGLLSEFTKKITGADKIRFRPHYFPFTEPSVEADIWSQSLNKWLEVFGAGIFRPEVTAPFGIKVPVLAWGIGFDRLFMIKNSIADIRQLFSQNLEYLRSTKI